MHTTFENRLYWRDCSVFSGPQKTVVLPVLKMGLKISGSSFLEWSGYFVWVLIENGKIALLSIITEKFLLISSFREIAKRMFTSLKIFFRLTICSQFSQNLQSKYRQRGKHTIFKEINHLLWQHFTTYSAFQFYFLRPCSQTWGLSPWYF